MIECGRERGAGTGTMGRLEQRLGRGPSTSLSGTALTDHRGKQRQSSHESKQCGERDGVRPVATKRARGREPKRFEPPSSQIQNKKTTGTRSFFSRHRVTVYSVYVQVCGNRAGDTHNRGKQELESCERVWESSIDLSSVAAQPFFSAHQAAHTLPTRPHTHTPSHTQQHLENPH